MSSAMQNTTLRAATKVLIRAALKKKQAEVAAKIERILTNQDISIGEMKLPQDGDPNETPLERLRKFAALLTAAEGRYETGAAGTCVKCGVAIPDAALIDTPWVDRCGACSAA